MMDIESKVWRIKSQNNGMIAVIRKATGVTQLVTPGKLPSIGALGAMHEREFDRTCLRAFNAARDDH